RNGLFAPGAPGGQRPGPVRWRRRPRTDKVHQVRTGARALTMRGLLLSIALLAGVVVVVLPAVQSQSHSTTQPPFPSPLPLSPSEGERGAAAPLAPASGERGRGEGAQQGREKEGKRATVDRSADEKAIRANVAAFAKAYNARDAKAIAALFTPDGQIVGKDSDTSEGRAAIQQAFADLFAENPQKRIEVTVESIRFIGSDLAVEQGSTKETDAPGEPPEYDRYTVLHVKRDGKWLMALARDEEGPPPSSHE